MEGGVGTGNPCSPTAQCPAGTPTPPPEYMMLTSYGGGQLNAVDLLQIHHSDFEQDNALLGGLDAGNTMGLIQDQFYPQPLEEQLQTTKSFDFGQFSCESRVDSPGSQKSGGSEGPDPFSPHCKIPLPTPYGPYEYWLEPSFIRRRNERERQRVRNVNEGFERLRSHLPLEGKERDKRLSKVETLRFAIDYIHDLKDILQDADEREQKQQQMDIGANKTGQNSRRNNYQ